MVIFMLARWTGERLTNAKQGGIVVSRFTGDGHSLQHTACGEGTKNGKRELKV